MPTLIALIVSLSAALAAPDYSALFSHEAPIEEAAGHLQTERRLSVGEVVTVWSDAESVGVLAAVGEDGLEGEAYIDEHDPSYLLVLHVFPPDAPELRRSQVLIDVDSISQVPVLQWSGDLDGDGRPDLLIDGAVLLSGQAVGDGLVGVLAEN
ncbi:MAG: hypothetical protein ACI8S6_001296 [Myxococcota bacterium]|jgi:hypothetical protein